MNKKVVLIVLDGVGAGAMEDAAEYKDEGANTLLNTLKATGVELPNLVSFGLFKILGLEGGPFSPLACYGVLEEKSKGKDTSAGHFELMGLITNIPAPTFPQGFPCELIEEFESRIGGKTLGNVPASGTEIIKRLGREHEETGYPIVYTSADSVFQIAAHENIITLDELYRISKIAREILKGEWAVERVIARPFIGRYPDYVRTPRRKDFALPPPGKTALDYLAEASVPVWVVGKIGDIFSMRGISKEIRTKTNRDGKEKILDSLKALDKGVIFANLNDFDTLYGHRRNPQLFSQALKEFDDFLPRLKEALGGDDLLILTADHGCDPTLTRHTDHTREKVPLMVYSPSMVRGRGLGVRETFADVGKSILDYFSISAKGLEGESFLSAIISNNSLN